MRIGGVRLKNMRVPLELMGTINEGAQKGENVQRRQGWNTAATKKCPEEKKVKKGNPKHIKSSG